MQGLGRSSGRPRPSCLGKSLLLLLSLPYIRPCKLTNNIDLISTLDISKSIDNVSPKKFINFFFFCKIKKILGGVWYFYSVYRETACWQHACVKYKGEGTCNVLCSDNIAADPAVSNSIAQRCPVRPFQTEVFDFGVFSNAIASNTTRITDNFLQKWAKCSWWGMKNLR